MNYRKFVTLYSEQQKSARTNVSNDNKSLKKINYFIVIGFMDLVKAFDNIALLHIVSSIHGDCLVHEYEFRSTILSPLFTAFRVKIAALWYDQGQQTEVKLNIHDLYVD